MSNIEEADYYIFCTEKQIAISIYGQSGKKENSVSHGS